jgi:hypothetical protein
MRGKNSHALPAHHFAKLRKANVQLHPGRPTIRDVAQLAGVSTATVSYVMNRTGVVSAETEQKVRLAIAALSYMPNAHARELACWRRLDINRDSS